MPKKADKNHADEFFARAKDEAKAAQKLKDEKDGAPWWNFEGKGGEEAQPDFAGYFVDATFIQKQGDTEPYDCVLAYFRDIEDVLYKAWFSAKGAVQGFRDAQPAVGTLVMVQFGGQKKTSDGVKYKAYSVIADEQDKALWDSYEAAYLSRLASLTAKGGGGGGGTTQPTISEDEAPF